MPNQRIAVKDELLDPRIYFAAERTLLAWVRTGLAMMGFGFVVARFGLFLRELAAVTMCGRNKIRVFRLALARLWWSWAYASTWGRPSSTGTRSGVWSEDSRCGFHHGRWEWSWRYYLAF